MRYHLTMPFSQAHTEYEAARHEYATFDDNDRAAEARANERLDKADEALWGAPAVTPTEIAMKIRAAQARGSEDFPIESFYSVKHMLADLERQQGWPCSPDVLAAWAAWRDHEERYEAAASRSDAEGDALLPERNALHKQLHETPCTTPGDFILKQYARLQGVIGHTLYGAAKDDMTGNRYDIDIDGEIMEGGLFEEVEYPALYHDIDATDVGANLLAYGLPYFSAEKWMERADAIGLRVNMVQQQDGSWMFGQHMDLEGEENRGNNERLRREQDRLMRIVAKDYGGERRASLLCDEIRREWPQLMFPNAIFEGRALLDSIGYSEDWTFEQLFEATRLLPKNDHDKVIAALRASGDAAQAEADALEAEALA